MIYVESVEFMDEAVAPVCWQCRLPHSGTGAFSVALRLFV